MNEVTEKLNQMFPKPQNRKKVVIMSSLTFGLDADSLSKLLGQDKDTINTELVQRSGFGTSLLNRWHRITSTPEESQARFCEFLERLYQAYVQRDTQAFRKILREITDYDFKQFIENHKKTDKLTPENILTILKYQVKYGLGIADVATICGVNRNSYSSKVHALLESYPEFQEYYDCLQTLIYQRTLEIRKAERKHV